MIASGILSSHLKNLNSVATKQGSVPAASEEPATPASMPADQLSLGDVISGGAVPQDSFGSSHNPIGSVRINFAAVFQDAHSINEYYRAQLSPEEAEASRQAEQRWLEWAKESGFDLSAAPKDDTTSMKDHLTNLIAAVEGGAGTGTELSDERFAEGTKALLDHLDFAFYRLRFFATRAGENIDGITKQYESAVNKIIDAIATREEARKAAPSQLA